MSPLSGEWLSARTQFVELLNYPDLDLQSMRGSRKFCQRGLTLTTFFILFFKLMRREMTINGPPAERCNLNDVSLGRPMMAQH